MTQERIEEMKKLAYQYQLLSCDFIFGGKYSNEEIEVFIEERQKFNDM